MAEDKKFVSVKPWEQLASMLDEPVPEALVQPPNKAAGIQGKYIKGQHAIMLANKLFGPANWSNEVVVCPHLAFSTDRYQVWACVVRVTATGVDEFGTRSASRDGAGCCWLIGGQGGIKPQQIDTAVKGAETDALKRALKNFGRHLGLDLYADEDIWQIVMAQWLADEPEPKPEPVSGQEKEPAADGDEDEQIDESGVTRVKYPKPDINAETVVILGRELDSKGMVGLDEKSAAWFKKELPKLFMFAGKGPYLENHLKKHFGTTDLGNLTYYQLAVLLHYGDTGQKDLDYYKEIEHKEPVAIPVEDSASIDAVVDIVKFMGDHDIPPEFLDDVTAAFFKDKAIGGMEAGVLLKTLTAYGETVGAEGIHKDGKMTKQFKMMLKAALESSSVKDGD